MWYPGKRAHEARKAQWEARAKASKEEFDARWERHIQQSRERQAKRKEEEAVAKAKGPLEWANFWVRQGKTDYANYIILYHLAENLGIDKPGEKADEKS